MPHNNITTTALSHTTRNSLARGLLDEIYFDRGDAADYSDEQAIDDCMYRRGGPRENKQCCSTGFPWTTLLTQYLICKFARHLELKSASWPSACDAAMALLKDAEEWLDNAHLRQLIKDCATLMHTRLFEKDPDCEWIREDCPVFYWQKDVMKNARKGLPLQFGPAQSYLYQAKMYREATRLVAPRYKDRFKRWNGKPPRRRR
jgi:hypothetical protein